MVSVQLHLFDLMRMMSSSIVNRNLAFQMFLRIDSIESDSFTTASIDSKLSPIYKLDAKVDRLELFSKVTSQKRLPNMSEMYLNKIVSIEEIIAIREQFNAKQFHKWFFDISQSPDDFNEELLRSIGKDTILKKAIRFSVPKLLSLKFPLAGLTVGLTNTFLLPHLSSSWHPNYFLDDTMGNKLHSYLNKTSESKAKKVGRNEKCYCGSGLKFKYCHGKS